MDRRARLAGARKQPYRLRAAAPLPGPKPGKPAPQRDVGSPAAAASEGLIDHAARGRPEAVPGPLKPLSVRAQNALKELAVELTGEQPPKGSWTPSRELLLALTAERLARARNCGPQTTREIIAWAEASGVTIRPTLPSTRSLPQMWAGLVAKASAGALTAGEVIEALDKSIRRKSVRIPVAFQLVLLQILLSLCE